MNYRKEFLKEYRLLKKYGTPEEIIEDYYTSTAREVIRSDDRHARHNKSLYSNSSNEKCNPDVFCYQRGHVKSQGKNAETQEEPEEIEKTIEELEKEEHSGKSKQKEVNTEEVENRIEWSSIKIIAVSLATEDNTDIYLEHVEITEQLADKELQNAIWSLSSRQQEILELLVDGWTQKKIAERLGISGAAVCKHVRVIANRLEPYYREYHWLKVNF